LQKHEHADASDGDNDVMNIPTKIAFLITNQ